MYLQPRRICKHDRTLAYRDVNDSLGMLVFTASCILSEQSVYVYCGLPLGVQGKLGHTKAAAFHLPIGVSGTHLTAPYSAVLDQYSLAFGSNPLLISRVCFTGVLGDTHGSDRFWSHFVKTSRRAFYAVSTHNVRIKSNFSWSRPSAMLTEIALAQRGGVWANVG